MKQYGVFVKFSNTTESKDLGGYQENNHNVIARTPAKNKANLFELEKCILESIQDVHLARKTETVEVPRELHRILNLFFSTNLRNAESDHDAKITFPDKEEACENVSVSGTSDEKLKIVKDIILVKILLLQAL